MPANLTLPEVVPYVRLHSLLKTVAITIGRNTTTPEITHFPNEARFSLTVHPKDQGRFIGKEGTTIWAIQTLFFFAGLAQLGFSYTIKLEDPDYRENDSTPFRFNANWSRKRIRELVDAIISTCIPLHANYTLVEPAKTKATINLTIQKYLWMTMDNPNFAEAFSIVLKVAGMSNGVNISAQTIFA